MIVGSSVFILTLSRGNPNPQIAFEFLKMETLISKIDNGLLSFISDDPFKDRSIFFNKGEAVAASFDRDAFDRASDGGSNDDDDDDEMEAYLKSYVPDPAEVRLYYSSKPVEVYKHECDSCDESKNEEVYCVRLDNEVHEKCVSSQCIELLKQANVDASCFFRVCMRDPWRFYAKLNDKQAEDVRGVEGIWNVQKHDELYFWCIVS